MVVLIPKGKGDYCRIGLVEVVWKVVVEILNHRITASITYHNSLHRSRAGCITGTANLHTKLLQQLAAMQEEVLYVICIDLHKAYETFDREKFLEILDGYSVVPRYCRILQAYWYRLQMAVRVVAYYGNSFKGFRGVTQGEYLSPTIFNGGGCSGLSLGIGDGRERGRGGLVQMGG